MSYSDAIKRGLQRRKENQMQGITPDTSTEQRETIGQSQEVRQQRVAKMKEAQEWFDQQKATDKVTSIDQNISRMNNSVYTGNNAANTAVQGAYEPISVAEAQQRIEEIDREIARLSPGASTNPYLRQQIQQLEQEKQEIAGRAIQTNDLQQSNPVADAPWRTTVADSAAAAVQAVRQNPAAYEEPAANASAEEKPTDFKSVIDLLADATNNRTSPTAKTYDDVSTAVNILNKYDGNLSAYSILVDKANTGDATAIRNLAQSGYAASAPVKEDEDSESWISKLFDTGNSATDNAFIDLVPDVTLDALRQAKANTKNDADRTYFTDLINRKIWTENATLMANTVMPGTDHSVLEEMYEVADMKNGAEKDGRELAIMRFMLSMGVDIRDEYAIYSGDGNLTGRGFFDWLGSAVKAGLSDFTNSIVKTVDTLNPLKAFGWANNPISKFAEKSEADNAALHYNAALNAAKLGGGGWNFATTALESTVASIPDAILALATAGASAGTATTASLTRTAAYQSGSLLTKAGLTTEAMMRNPSYWTAFAREYGGDYEEALQTLADDSGNLSEADYYKAALGATATALLNAGIEIGFDGGSGIQGLPSDLANGDSGKLLNWFVSSLEEGGEEWLQGDVTSLISYALYGTDSPLPNLEDSSREALLGFISGAIMGGGQALVNSNANTGDAQEIASPTNAEQLANTETVQEVSAVEDMADRLVPIQSAVTAYQNTGTVSNRMADIILSQSQAVQALSAATGVEITGTASQQRQAVKTAIAALSQQQNATETITPSPTTDTTEAFRQAAREVMGLETETPAEVQPQPETRLPEATAAPSTAITQDGNAPAGATQPDTSQNATETLTKEQILALPADQLAAYVDAMPQAKYTAFARSLTDSEYNALMDTLEAAEKTDTTGQAQTDFDLSPDWEHEFLMSLDPADSYLREGVEDPMADRDPTEVGNRKVNAYQYEHPEVQPYFMDQAAWMLSELADTTKAERVFNEDLHYESGGEKGWFGTKRHTSESIAELLDDYHLTYDQIERGLNDIVRDNGSENHAAAKRVEFVLNDRLLYGYTDFWTGKRVPPNQEYINLLRTMQNGGDTTSHPANATVTPVSTPASTDSEWSVGAANADFTGKAAYNELLSDENSQPDRPTDVRPMEVLETDPYGRKVTEFAANAYGAGVTSDAMADRIQELIMEGALGFDTKTNEQTLAEASREMVGKSKEKIQSEIIGNISDGHIKDGDIAKAMLLYADYAAGESADSQNNAAEMMVALSMMANKAGRDLQLFSMLRRMTPQGQLMAVEKTIQKQIAKMNQGRSNSRQIQDVSISPELQQEYMEAAKEDSAKKTKETAMRKAAAEDAIYKEAASQIKATPKEKWDTYRYMCMLGNARTNIRNVFGNAMYIPYTEGKRIIGTAMEKMFLPEEQRTKALLGLSESDQALLKWAREDAKTTAADALKYSARIGDDVSAAKLQNERQIFDSALMENVRKLVEWAPSAGDMLFKNAEYSKSLAGFLKARGYTVGDIESNSVSDAVLGEARAYAVQEAMKATFNDCNILSDFAANTLRFKGDNPVAISANAMLEGVLPFRRTPANIIVRALENSPLGLARGLFNAATKVRSGEMSAATAIDQIAAGLTGSAAYALGFALANGIGAIRLRGYLDDEDKERQGYQSYALEITANGKVYSYDISWAAPANLPLFVGANLYQAFFQEDEDADLTVFTKALYGCVNVLEPMLELSCLSSLTDLLESVRYADSGEIVYTVAVEAATSYFTQGIPTLLRQAYQASQTTKQQTFANSEDPLIRSLQRKAANIPFVGAAFQTDKVDEWGEPVSRGNIGKRILDAFFNPGNYSVIETDALEQEIASLNNKGMSVDPPDISKTISFTDADGNVYKDRRLTEEEYNTLRTVQGQTSAEILNDMISTGDYAALPDDLKAKAFEYAYDYARETARSQAIDGYSVTASWMQGIEENTAAAIIQKVTAGELSSASTALTASWKSGTGADAALDTMESAYQTYLSMSDETRSAVLENSASTVQTYIDFRENGGTASEYATIYQPVTLGKDAISSAQSAFKKGEAVSEDTLSGMASAYQQYKDATTPQKKAILEASTKATAAMLKAMDAGVSAGTFMELYGEYYAISNTDEKPSAQANSWAHTLQKAVERGQITQAQADILKNGLTISSGFTVETGTFDTFLETGLSSDQSYDLMDLLSGIEAEEGYANVRPVQKVEAVASSAFLSEAEKAEVMKIYLGDSQDEALDRFLDAGYSTKTYADVYRIYLNSNRGKDKTVAALQDKYGISEDAATAVYNLLVGK